MKVFCKYVLKSMLEKKGRFLLLIIAIAMSTGLLVASTGLIDIMIDSMTKPILETYENKQIVINPKEEGTTFFDDDNITIAGIKEDSILKEIYLTGEIIDKVDTPDETMLNVTIRGRDVSKVNSDLVTQGSLDNFTDASCIISERIAKDRNLKLNDTMEVIIGGMKKELKITAICGTSGVFYNDKSTSFALLVPYEYLNEDLKLDGKYNLIMANSSESSLEKGIESFNKSNTEFQAAKLFDIDSVREQTASFKMILYVLLLVVVIMSGIIIFSSFKLIITERLTTIGTFLSQGATLGKVKFILRLESLFYGILGAVFGNVLGLIALNVINRAVSPLKEYGIYEPVNIKPYYIITGVLFAIILSLVSSYIPVRKISKLQVKEVILNDVRISMKLGWKKFIIGSVIFLASLATYLIGKDSIGAVSGLLIVTSLTGIILAYPKLIDIFSIGLYRVLRGRSKNVLFAVNNLRTSKILLGNITLIIISLFSIISISSIGKSMISVVTEAYTQMNYDIEISSISTIRENTDETTADYLVKELVKIGVDEEDINLVTSQYVDVYMNDDKDTVTGMQGIGIDIDDYTRYNTYLHLDSDRYKEYIESFRNDPNGVIVTSVVTRNSNKKVGDKITISCNGIKKELTINGVIEAKLYNNGYLVILKNETMKEQFGINSANSLTFDTSKDLDGIIKNMKPILRDIGATYITKDEQCENNLKQNQRMVDILSIFSYMAIIIASLGIINNVSISFLQRKSEFAVLSSVGMENRGRNRILLFESIASVTWAMLITVLYCILGMNMLSSLMEALGIAMDITLSYSSLPMIYLVSLAIVLIATIPVYFKSRKLSIIQELKYE
ncbi:MAG TPA: FtsX-like permease family protein [Lachnospiraceae bacterium]|nr:FtsX-like permease family protein [Lachnospiraceae bacterium]